MTRAHRCASLNGPDVPGTPACTRDAGHTGAHVHDCGKHDCPRTTWPVSPTRWAEGDAGCIIDGHWGQYATALLVTVAADAGWTGDPVGIDAAERHVACMGPSTAPDVSDDDHEAIVSAADAAESWMTATLAPEGYAFGWHDGEFYLWPLDDDEDGPS